MMSTPQELEEIKALALRVVDVRERLAPDHTLAAYAAFDSAVADLQARLTPERLVSLIETHQRLAARVSQLEQGLP